MNGPHIKKALFLSMLATALVLLAASGGSARAQDDWWFARFWNNTSFSGSPVFERYDRNIDFNWGGGSPDELVNDDNFSATWERRVYFEPGVYRFNATMDDGMRVYLDDRLIIDSWTFSQEHTMTVDFPVAAGDHNIRVEYFEAGGMAVAKVNWQLIQPDGGSGGGGGNFFPNWRAEYYNNTSLAGTPSLVRDDRYLNHDWGMGSPAPGVISADFFSARWTKTLDGTPGHYTISMTSDDGSRLYIANQLMIDNWAIQGPTTKTIGYFYPGGPVEVRVEYFEHNENASIEVHLGVAFPGSGQAATPPSTGSCAQPGVQQAYVNTSLLNFREGPAVQFAVLATLPQCEVVGLTGYRNALGGAPWVQVTLPDGRTAWANANYLVLGAPIEQLAVLTD